jgi:hypothetical protein
MAGGDCNGDGSFQPAQSFVTGFSASTLAVADFNGDGVPDLAVCNFLDVSTFHGTVTILLNTED